MFQMLDPGRINFIQIILFLVSAPLSLQWPAHAILIIKRAITSSYPLTPNKKYLCYC